MTSSDGLVGYLTSILAVVDAAAPISIDAPLSLVAIGAEPPASVSEAIIRKVVRAYPAGGNHLEAALRVAIRIAWAARHEFAWCEREAG